ncbi:MAG: DNA primase, partial [Oscillospiraceae bacterium]|nr:DNA primase [Oscillospiraceae bacterium]
MEQHPMVCVGGKLFDVDGEIEQDRLSNTISSEIMRYMMTGISKKVKAIMDALKLYCYREELPLRDDEIHLQNGTLRMDGTFTEEKVFCRNRLNVSYREFGNEPYYPEHFLQFLLGLLDTEDIMTLQEYLGYCLIPSTKGQKMLFLIGSGGEGKSRIGVVLQEIFGRNMLTGSFQRIETDRFFRYNLQNKLLMIDDDMQLSALASTGYIKNLITAETPIDVEAKGEQSR